MEENIRKYFSNEKIPLSEPRVQACSQSRTQISHGQAKIISTFPNRLRSGYEITKLVPGQNRE